MTTTKLEGISISKEADGWESSEVSKRCLTCGRDFEGVPQRKYCCNRCKALGWYREKKQRKKI